MKTVEGWIKQQKKQMWNNFWKGGRTIAYIRKRQILLIRFPPTRFRFSTGQLSGWDMDPLISGRVHPHWPRSSGNFIQNTRKKMHTADFNLTRLYAKWRLLRELDQQTTAASAKSAGKK